MAFLIDPSISQQAKIPNLADVYQQIQQINAGKQEQQLRQISLAQATQGMQDNQDLRSAYSQANGDPNGTVAALRTKNPYVAQQEQTRLTKSRQDAEEAALKVQKAKLENTAAQTQGFASLLNGVQDAPSYQAAVQSAVQKGFITPEDMQHIPAYSPQAVQQLQSAALTHNQKIQADLQAHTAAETARHNQQTETTATATQSETADYHGIEANQRKQQLGIEGARLNLEKQKQGSDQTQAVEQQAQQIANGDVKGLSQARNNPFARAVMARVYEINPKYSDSLYTATQALRSDKPNSMGANVGRLGTAVLHADAALNNSHALGFSEGLLTGVATEGTAKYKQDAEFLTGEVGQFVTGGKLTVDEGNKISKDLMSSRQSVRDAAIHSILDLSGGKLKSQMEQFKNATQTEFPTDRVFNDPAIAGALQKHGIIKAPGSQEAVTSSPQSGLGVKLSDAMNLPQNKGKSAEQVAADIQAHGHKVIQ